eukprot:SAG31_NODE_60_length_29419_cov_39.876398_5_plen_78_part_00
MPSQAYEYDALKASCANDLGSHLGALAEKVAVTSLLTGCEELCEKASGQNAPKKKKKKMKKKAHQQKIERVKSKEEL